MICMSFSVLIIKILFGVLKILFVRFGRYKIYLRFRVMSFYFIGIYWICLFW